MEKEIIRQRAEELRADLVEFLMNIIAIPSVSREEKQVIKRIQKEMEKLGYDKIWVDEFGNLLGQIGTGSKIIALDGHCDTVDTGDISQWNHNPFKGKLENEIVYGRGACDQKGGLAAAILYIRVKFSKRLT